MNGDKHPDIVLIGFQGVVWYESPTWARHSIIADGTTQNISGAVYDIDGDSRAGRDGRLRLEFLKHAQGRKHLVG